MSDPVVIKFNMPKFTSERPKLRIMGNMEGPVTKEKLLESYTEYQELKNFDNEFSLDVRHALTMFITKTQKILSKMGKEYYIEKFGISDEGFLKLVSEYKYFSLRITKSHSKGLQLHNTVYSTPSVMSYITDKFTTDEIISNYELIPETFLISDFCIRDDFTSEKLLELQHLVSSSNMENNFKDMIMYDLCFFAGHMKDSTPGFNWDFVEKYKESNAHLFGEGSYNVY